MTKFSRLLLTATAVMTLATAAYAMDEAPTRDLSAAQRKVNTTSAELTDLATAAGTAAGYTAARAGMNGVNAAYVAGATAGLTTADPVDMELALKAMIYARLVAFTSAAGADAGGAAFNNIGAGWPADLPAPTSAATLTWAHVAYLLSQYSFA